MTLVELPAGEARLAALPLLLLADDAADHVRANLDEGDVFALLEHDDEGHGDGTPIGAVQCVARPDDPHDDATVELTLVAVREDRQQQGVGQCLVAQVLEELRKKGYRRAIVGTSNAGVGEFVFYQRCGFRMLSIERDYFDEARGYDGTEQEHGLVHRDLVWFDQPLA